MNDGVSGTTLQVVPNDLLNVGITSIVITPLQGIPLDGLEVEYEDGTSDQFTGINSETICNLQNKKLSFADINLTYSAVFKIALYKGDEMVGSYCGNEPNTSQTTEVKYKVDLQAANANVNVWDESVGPVTALSWQSGLELLQNQANIIHKRGTFSNEFSMRGTSGERELEDGENTTSLVIQAGTNPIVLWLANFKLTKDNGQVIDYVPTAGRNSVVTIL